MSGKSAQYVYRSTDGGTTWGYSSSVPDDGGAVAFVTASRWLQITVPTSKETTDGGASWHPFTTDYSQAAPIAPSIVFGDAQTGYATVRGAIQRTTDGGVHWTYIGTPGRLLAGAIPDSRSQEKGGSGLRSRPGLRPTRRGDEVRALARNRHTSVESRVSLRWR